jgi:subtilisin family serine protease
MAQSNGRGDRGDKLDKFLRNRARQVSGRTRVIVQFKGDSDVRVLGKRAAAGRKLGRGGQVAEVDNVELSKIASDPRVDGVYLDRPIFATLDRTTASTGAADVRQQLGLTGRNVGVAVIDSGITNWHDDLYRNTNRVAHFKDFTNSTSVWSNGASDAYGHGTHVAGIIAGTGYDSSGKHRGIAPGAKLIGLKVMDGLGHGYMSDVIAAIDYAVSVKSTYNIRVINLSVAAGVFESYWYDPLTLAAKRAVDAGIVVVASAGNLGRDKFGKAQTGGITSPGNAPWVLTVGASSEEGSKSRGNDSVASFSSRGPTWIDFGAKPDIVAPGVGIESITDSHSLLYTTLPLMRVSGSLGLGLTYKPYLSLSGTSMSAPVVSGTVALMLEANPKLTPNAVKAILQYTAEVRNSTSLLVQGAGVLNAEGAVRLAKYFAAPATTDLGDMRDYIQGQWVPWARHLIWGNYRITGGMPLPGSNAWSTSVRWGSLKTSTGARVVWGTRLDDNIVWSTASDDNIVWSTGTDDNIVWSTAGADNIVWSTGGDDNIVWSTGGDDNIVWSTSEQENIVWSTGSDDNIVWSTAGEDNIVWSTNTVTNVVWGNDCGGRNCKRIVWGAQQNGVVMGTASGDDNIVWSTAADDNIVWSTAGDDNIVWSTGSGDDNIVWSTAADDNIVWSTGSDDNIVWSTSEAIEEVLWDEEIDPLVIP